MGISKELTEEDIKFRYINEAITSKGWSKDSIFMEQKVKFTDGKISLDRKSTRLNSSHWNKSRMPSSA